MLRKSLALICTTACFVACGDEDTDPTPQGPLEIIGVWASEYGTEEVITIDRFNRATIHWYDNASNTLVSQNPADDAYFPSRFSKVQWTELEDGRFYYCTIDFDLESEEAARNSSSEADASNPAVSGCGMFPWTAVREPIALVGQYADQFDNLETITSTSWVQYGVPNRLVDWDLGAHYAILLSPSDADFAPDTYSRLQLTEADASGTFAYCTVAYALTTLEEAQTSTQTADASDLEAGCGAFPWSKLTPR